MPETYEEPKPYPLCDVCQRPMVAQRAWNAESPGDRQEMRLEGYVRHGAAGLCANDYAKACYTPVADRW